MNTQIPNWLAQMDAQEAQPDTNPTAQPLVAPNPAGPQQTPAWLTQMDHEAPEQVTVTGQQPESTGQDLGDLAANVATGVGRVPGAIIGTPHVLMHTLDWLGAKLKNMTDGGNRTGADVDAQNPIDKVLPTSEGVDKHVFDTLGVKPYEPTSFIGKLLQAGVTGAGAGLVDPGALLGVMKAGTPLASVLEGAIPRMAKTAVAADAANTVQQTFPDNPALAAAAAVLAHGGTAAAMRGTSVAGGVAGDVGRQLFSPAKQGEIEAGRALGEVDNTQPGLISPTPTDIASAQGDVRAATDAFDAGEPDFMAGSNLRAGLQARSNALKQARDAGTADLRDARDGSSALVNTAPVLGLIDQKLGVAAGAQQSALQGAKGDLYLANGSERVTADQLAASRQAINARINDAVRAGDNATASHLIDVRNTLDAQINKAVPEAGQFTAKYSELSRPLDPMEYGPVAKVLARDQYNSRYTLADERVPDTFLRSTAARNDLNQLIAAHGGDKSAALGSLQNYLAGVAQTAVKTDGTLDAAAFDKAMAPYQKSLGNLGVWFPELARKFNTAKQAQATLDTISAQRGLADAVGNGALRDDDGTVTGPSFTRWLNANKDQLGKTQNTAAVMRLRSIADTLRKSPPGELADALKSEIVPTAIGTMFAGLEGGVAAVLQHRFTQAVLRNPDAARKAAFSEAIERATTDPAYAQRLAATSAKLGRGASPVRALVRAIVATPLALNAGAPLSP